MLAHSVVPNSYRSLVVQRFSRAHGTMCTRVSTNCLPQFPHVAYSLVSFNVFPSDNPWEPSMETLGNNPWKLSRNLDKTFLELS